MVIMFDGPVTPDDLTDFVRELPAANNLVLLNEFPVRYHEDNQLDFGEIIRTNRTARYRNFDGSIHVSRRDAASERKVRLAPLSTSLSLGEYERLQQEFARLGGTNERARERAVYNDAERLIGEVYNRLELAWGDTLTDGTLTITELQQVAEYGIPGNHLVAPSIAWTSTSTATVLTDIEAWAKRWRLTNGSRPGRMKTSERVIGLVRRNAEVISSIKGAAAGHTRVKLSEVNDLLRDEQLPTFDDAYDSELEHDGNNVRTVPDDRVAMLPQDLSELGHTAIGVSATALELVGSNQSEFDFEDALGIVGVVEKVGPPYREFVYVDGTGQPVLDNAKKLLVADVA